MDNLVSIKLPTGQTIELFSSSGKIVANLMSPAGYGVSHQHLSETQIDRLRTLVESIEPTPLCETIEANSNLGTQKDVS